MTLLFALMISLHASELETERPVRDWAKSRDSVALGEHEKARIRIFVDQLLSPSKSTTSASNAAASSSSK